MSEPQRDRDAERLTEDIATRVTAKLIDRAEGMGFDFLTREGRATAAADFQFLRMLREDSKNLMADFRFLRTLQEDRERLLTDLRYLRDIREAKAAKDDALTWWKILPGMLITLIVGAALTYLGMWLKGHP
jgi:hypothetical protein